MISSLTDSAQESETWRGSITRPSFVHFVICDRKGEWVIVDMQNSHQPD